MCAPVPMPRATANSISQARSATGSHRPEFRGGWLPQSHRRGACGATPSQSARNACHDVGSSDEHPSPLRSGDPGCTCALVEDDRSTVRRGCSSSGLNSITIGAHAWGVKHWLSTLGVLLLELSAGYESCWELHCASTRPGWSSDPTSWPITRRSGSGAVAAGAALSPNLEHIRSRLQQLVHLLFGKEGPCSRAAIFRSRSPRALLQTAMEVHYLAMGP